MSVTRQPKGGKCNNSEKTGKLKGHLMPFVVKTAQRAFSMWIFNEFKQQFGITAENYNDFAKFELSLAGVHEADIKSCIENALEQTC